MSNKEWSPGHSLNKGYPYNGIESKRMMKSRPKLSQNEEAKIEIDLNFDLFSDLKPEDVQKERTPFEDFLLFRLFDFQESLSVAEGQIFDLLEEKPFLPENYGFILAHKNAEPNQPPSRVYVSKFDHRYSLFRKPAPEGFTQDPALWTILKKEDDGTFHENDVMIPCDRIAYALFYAMRIQVSKEPVQEVLVPLEAIKEPKENMKNNHFTVIFKRGQVTASCDVEADTVSDAFSRAKFHFETEPDFGIQDITPEELSIG